MKSAEQIVTDKEIDKVWGNANFGTTTKREVIREALGKCATGYSSGHTATCIVTELGLIENGYLSDKGYEYLIASYAEASKPMGAREYQRCPICNGEGKVPTPLSTTTHTICDVCNGAKIIPKYYLNREPSKEQPPVFEGKGIEEKEPIERQVIKLLGLCR